MKEQLVFITMKDNLSFDILWGHFAISFENKGAISNEFI